MTDARPRTPAHGQPVIVTLPAELDIASAGPAGEQLAAALTPGTRVVIADMTATTFCDSMGIGTLVRAHKQATANGIQLRLLLPSPNVLRVLTIQGIETMLSVYDSLEQALAPPGRIGNLPRTFGPSSPRNARRPLAAPGATVPHPGATG